MSFREYSVQPEKLIPLFGKYTISVNGSADRKAVSRILLRGNLKIPPAKRIRHVKKADVAKTSAFPFS